MPAARQTVHLAIWPPKETAGEAKKGVQGLTEIGSSGEVIPANLVSGSSASGTADSLQIAASIPPRGDAQRPRRFKIVFGNPSRASASEFRFTQPDGKSVGLWDGERPVLVYNYGVVTDESVPKTDSRRSRGCYIHPVYGLDGGVLTDDFPKDHYHHHGIFWSWPHVEIGGREYDLWIYKNIEQRFVRWLGRECGSAAASLGVENGWFVGEKKVMIERVWVRVYKPAGIERSIDLEFTWIPVEEPITLRGAEGKSYGGLNLRYAPRPEKETVITVPSGRTKADLPDTPLAWADLSAKFPGGCEPQWCGDFRRSGPSRFPAHLAHPPLRYSLCRLAGRACEDVPAGRAHPLELPSLDPQGNGRASRLARGVRCLWGGP